MDPVRERLAFLLETAALEAKHLLATDLRLFSETFTPERAAAARDDADLSERLDACCVRFARLQDLAGDKLLPVLLARLGETVGSVLDNLDRASRLGLLTESSEDCIAARALRDRMVHEYIRKPALLAQAFNEAHAAVPMLVGSVQSCEAYVAQRTLT